MDSVTKTCLDCGETKPLSEFHRDRSTRSGYRCYCKPCNIARSTEWAQRDPQRYNFRRTAWRYGLTPAVLQGMIEAQDNKCGICRREFVPGNIETTYHVDHDHVTGRIRGLLCLRCNLGVSAYESGADLDKIKAWCS